MRKRIRSLLVVLLFAVLGGLAWQVLRPREPVYQGRPISYWIDHTGEISLAGNASIGEWNGPQLDSNAVPFLVKALQTRDGRLGAAYRNAWLRSPLFVRKLLPRPIWVRAVPVSAAQALGQLGKDAKPAIPGLARLVKEDHFDAINRHQAAAWALGKIDAKDPVARAALIGAENDSDPTVRSVATNALKAIDPEAAAKAGAK